MKILDLIIKQSFFDQIIKGEKKQEFREVKPTTLKKYFNPEEVTISKLEDGEGNIYEVGVYANPIKYDAIRFYVGYNKGRNTALVEVAGAECHEDNNCIIEERDGRLFAAEVIVYNLGNILKINDL